MSLEKLQLGVRITERGMKRLARLQAALRTEIAQSTGVDKPVSQSDAVEMLLKKWEDGNK
jgi:hypothetical protein